MKMTWRLREFLAERGFRRASHISRIIAERTGYKLSTQAVCDLLNGPPKMLRVETIQAICDAFYCRLADFCDVIPQASSCELMKRKEVVRSTGKGITQNTIAKQRSSLDFAEFFPDARQYAREPAQ
jgi:DNA-binding Xre family transcriptional regulator